MDFFLKVAFRSVEGGDEVDSRLVVENSLENRCQFFHLCRVLMDYFLLEHNGTVALRKGERNVCGEFG